MTDVAHYKTDTIDRRFVAASIAFLDPYVSSESVLNLGVGYGVWDAFLAARCKAITSLDVNRDIIEIARTQCPNVEYVLSDVFDFKPNTKFDTVVCSHFLEHIEEPVGLLQLLRSWLTPGGRILIVVPNALSLHRKIGVAMGLLDNPYELNDSDLLLGHRRVYDLARLREDLTAGGCEIHLIRSFSLKPVSNSMFAALGERYLEVCLDASLDWGDGGGQLMAVVS